MREQSFLFALLQYLALQFGNIRPGGNSKPRFFSGPGTNNFDTALLKDTKVSEGVSVQARFEFFNTLNHAQFQAPSGNYNSGSFGYVTNANDPRIGQVALKVLF